MNDKERWRIALAAVNGRYQYMCLICLVADCRDPRKAGRFLCGDPIHDPRTPGPTSPETDHTTAI